jgi:glycosyltransferase involved in cell wall biosynthesis
MIDLVPRSASTPLAASPLAAVPGPAVALPDHHLSVVVPMFDEVDCASPMLAAIEAALSDYPHPWELVVVDDGSRDGTGEVLRREAARLGRHVRVLRLLRNQGQSAALQAGIDAARGDVIVTLDGDLQNDPRDIPRLVERLLREDLDLVAGWRRGRRDALLLRKVPSWLANRLIRRATGLRFRDLGCSLKAFRAPVLRAIRLRGEMHRFIPAWLATVTSPARMAEEPVRHHPRRHGASKYGLSRTVRVVLDLVAVRFFLRYRSRPGHFFGGAGLAALAGAAALIAWGTLRGLPTGVAPLPTALLVLGAQLVALGVLAELLIRSGPPDAPPARREEAPGEPGGWHHARR